MPPMRIERTIRVPERPGNTSAALRRQRDNHDLASLSLSGLWSMAERSLPPFRAAISRLGRPMISRMNASRGRPHINESSPYMVMKKHRKPIGHVGVVARHAYAGNTGKAHTLTAQRSHMGAKISGCWGRISLAPHFRQPDALSNHIKPAMSISQRGGPRSSVVIHCTQEVGKRIYNCNLCRNARLIQWQPRARFQCYAIKCLR